MSSPEISIDQLVPGGIRPDDHWHHSTYDDTCSRCRQPIAEDEVPLLIWRGEDGADMLSYCPTCMG